MLNNQEIKIPVLLEDLGISTPNETSKYKVRYGLYECFCGNKFKGRMCDVKRNKIQSCGCYQKIKASTHGMSNTEFYSMWQGMISRTTNHNRKDFKHYGGRGISVCKEWKDDINNFIAWANSNKYSKGLSIDRIDNDKGYGPDNCRFVNQFVQTRNTSVIQSNNTSGYRGVSFHKKTNKWSSKIRVNKKDIHLGYFNKPLEAGIAYDNYVIENNLEHTTNSLLQNPQLTFVES